MLLGIVMPGATSGTARDCDAIRGSFLTAAVSG